MFYVKQSSREKGSFAENLAASFLKRKSFEILEQNAYLGHLEIDIVAKKGDKIHFFEVKSVLHETFSNEKEHFDPFENMTEKKLRRLEAACSLYMQKRPEKDFDLKLILVTYSKRDKKAKFKLFDLF